MALTQGFGFAVLGESLEQVTNNLVKLELAEKEYEQKVFKIQEGNRAFKYFNDKVNEYVSKGMSQSVAFTKATQDIGKLLTKSGVLSINEVLATVNQYKAIADFNTQADAIVKLLNETGSHVSAKILTGIKNGDSEAINKANEKVRTALEIENIKTEIELYRQQGNLTELHINKFSEGAKRLINDNFNDLTSDIYTGVIDNINVAIEKYEEMWDKTNTFVADIYKNVPENLKEIAYKKENELLELKNKQIQSIIQAFKLKQNYEKALKEKQFFDSEYAKRYMENFIDISQNFIQLKNLMLFGTKDGAALLNGLITAETLTTDENLKKKIRDKIELIVSTVVDNKQFNIQNVLNLSKYSKAWTKLYNHEQLDINDFNSIMLNLFHYRNFINGRKEDINPVDLVVTMNLLPVDLAHLRNELKKYKNELMKQKTDKGVILYDVYLDTIDWLNDKLLIGETLLHGVKNDKQ